MSDRSINISQYRWAGSWGPFKIKVRCGECTLSSDIIRDTLETELVGIDVVFETHDWLSEWWQPLFKGGWHAPIIMVDGKVISQGGALNRGVLIQAVIQAHAERTKIEGNHLFGKEGCLFCKGAREELAAAGIEYVFHDVVKKPNALYEMLARVKPIIGPKTTVTVPQIWLDGQYIGGSDSLDEFLKK